MSFSFIPLDLAGVYEVRPDKHGDARGFFSETWNAEMFRQHGHALNFVQDNHSYSREHGVLRGLHFQSGNHAQDKLVRVVRGRVFDVAVDIRPMSPTFAKWVGLELSAEDWNQILVPKGFAHGFVTLEPNTEVVYKVTSLYSRDHDRAIRFDDPQIGIQWPLPANELVLSEKDRAAPLLRDAELANSDGGRR